MNCQLADEAKCMLKAGSRVECKHLRSRVLHEIDARQRMHGGKLGAADERVVNPLEHDVKAKSKKQRSQRQIQLPQCST